MELSRVYSKVLPSFSAGVFLISAFVCFIFKYTGPEAVLQPFFDSGEEANNLLFYINFYVSFSLCFLGLCGCLFSSGIYLQGFCLFTGLATAVIAGYVLNDLFTINLCMYSACLIIISTAFSPPGNIIISGFSILFFLFFSFHPAFLGFPLGQLRFPVPDVFQLIILGAYLFCPAVMGFSIQRLSESYVTSEAKAAHLNQVGTKMLLFNHRLQDYVKSRGDEAVKKDRLRFTGDLHDSCGYVFTNIIAISDAAISCGAMETGKMQETFHLIRNLARDGLTRTRETLHMIRELQDSASSSIDTVYQMKSIFEDVMGIKVDIESGNMKPDYGPIVNTALTRIVQEAFTNSIRHGFATHIQIQFWEFPSILTMYIADNGIGSQNIVKGIGLAGMEERLAAVGGNLEVFSPKDGGFRLKVEIPLITDRNAS